jgi:hypothetical protein
MHEPIRRETDRATFEEPLGGTGVARGYFWGYTESPTDSSHCVPKVYEGSLNEWGSFPAGVVPG